MATEQRLNVRFTWWHSCIRKRAGSPKAKPFPFLSLIVWGVLNVYYQLWHDNIKLNLHVLLSKMDKFCMVLILDSLVFFRSRSCSNFLSVNCQTFNIFPFFISLTMHYWIRGVSYEIVSVSRKKTPARMTWALPDVFRWDELSSFYNF